MNEHDYERVLRLPNLIVRTRNPARKLALAREMRRLTEQYRDSRRPNNSAMEREQHG